MNGHQRRLWQVSLGALSIAVMVIIAFFSAAALQPVAAQAPTTWYVRPDGGSTAQCTGKVNAPYPGSGSNQPCAWDHPFRAFPPTQTARIRGGDTLIIANGSYMMGYGAPETTEGNCYAPHAWGCYMSPIPSGPNANQPTRILGEGWNHRCRTAPELWGTQRANIVLNLTKTSHLQMACLEITDHAGCVDLHQNPAVRCQRDTYPFGEWAGHGLWAEDSTNVTLRHLNIHGLSTSGVVAGRLQDWLLEDVRIAANGFVGWDGELHGQPLNSANRGNLIFRRWVVEWNGCAESWPQKQVNNCWGQSAGGYGDGVGTANTGGHWQIEDSIVRYNSSDGLDLLYTVNGTINVQRSRFYGNAGNQLKTKGPISVTNSLLVSNCDFFLGKPFTHHVDHCRSAGAAFALALRGNETAVITNNTLASHGDCIVTASNGEDVNSTAKIIMRNNIFQGYPSVISGNPPTQDSCLAYEADISGDAFDIDYSVINGVRHNLCPGAVAVCNQGAGLRNLDIDQFDGYLLANSPAINRGSTSQAPTNDIDGNVRDGQPDIGAYEWLAAPPPATATATATLLPATHTLTPTPTATRIAPTHTATPTPTSVAPNPQNPFDALYPSSFRLRPLAAEAIPVVAKPAAKASGLSAPSYIDPVYNTRVYRVSATTDFAGADFVRHDYSRRQAFNANHTRFIALTSDGYWLLYDANTFQVLQRSGHQGALQGMAGDCEAIWHPTDPTKLWYTGYAGALRWYEKNVETDTDTLLVDFTGRLPWPRAQSVWTKSEGTSSADGRYWAFMATAYDDATQTNTIYGLFTWDRQLDRIMGTYDAANFGGAFPDHISISPSGRYVVPSWAFNRTLGTRAYPLDFSSSIQLNRDSEHSDLAIGPNGEDFYVATDYDGSGTLRAVNIATGVSFDLMPLYPVSGEGYAAHISGKAYDRPGWVVISTYADGADYGNLQPAPTLRPMYRKIMLVELKPGGRQYTVAHTRTGANYGGYWGEPQATISRDGARLLFASNFDDGGPPSLYLVGLPSWVYGDSAPPTPTPTSTPMPSQSAAITIGVDAIPDSIQNFRFSGDLGNFALDDANPDDGDQAQRTRTVRRPAGVYAITPIVPTGWFVNVACTPAAHAQIEGVGQVRLTVAAGDVVACTFTYQRGGRIYTRAFNDRNGDGRRQSVEPWLTGQAMTVYDAQEVLVASGQTNHLGKVNFINLRPGFYTVCTALPSGWQSTLPGTIDPDYQQPCYVVVIAPNQTATLTFGNRQTATGGSTEAPPTAGGLPSAGIVLHENDDVPTDEMGYDGNLWVDTDVDQPVLDQPVYLPLVQTEGR